MSEAQQELLDRMREATDVLARDYALRRNADPAFDPDGFFVDLRRLVEARAITLTLVLRQGSMGGGGEDEA